MKICIAQTEPVKGDIDKNIERHIGLIDLAVKKGADSIIFPELSLTGYEPELSEKLATDPDDKRFDVFQRISDIHQLLIGVGVPTKHQKGICISTLIFRPGLSRESYSKKYLHPGEGKHFFPGTNMPPFKFKNNTLGFAICYETSIPGHSRNLYERGVNIYMASVLNSVDSVDPDIDRISAIAKKYQMYALMSNFVGESGGHTCAGKSSIWNNKGDLMVQLDTINEGIAIMDIDSQETIKIHTEKPVPL